MFSIQSVVGGRDARAESEVSGEVITQEARQLGERFLDELRPPPEAGSRFLVAVEEVATCRTASRHGGMHGQGMFRLLENKGGGIYDSYVQGFSHGSAECYNWMPTIDGSLALTLEDTGGLPGLDTEEAGAFCDRLTECIPAFEALAEGYESIIYKVSGLAGWPDGQTESEGEAEAKGPEIIGGGAVTAGLAEFYDAVVAELRTSAEDARLFIKEMRARLGEVVDRGLTELNALGADNARGSEGVSRANIGPLCDSTGPRFGSSI